MDKTRVATKKRKRTGTSKVPPPPDPYPLRVQNVVATMWAGVELHLRSVAQIVKGRLNKKVFPAAIGHMHLPTCTPSVFANGCHLIVGTCHKSDSLLAAHLILYQYVTKLHITPRFHNFKVRNVVCSLSLGHYLDIVSFWRDHRAHCVYTPESFEALHFYFIRNPFSHRRSTVFVMFRSGKMLLTGGTSREQLLGYLRLMLPTLRQYRCDAPPQPPAHGTNLRGRALRIHRAVLVEHRKLGVDAPEGSGTDSEDEDDDEEDEEDEDEKTSQDPCPPLSGYCSQPADTTSRLRLNTFDKPMRTFHLEGQTKPKRFKPSLCAVPGTAEALTQNPHNLRNKPPLL